MKNEHEFNAYITKSIKQMGTQYKVIKASDRFRIGMADWLVVHRGLVIAMEGKFIKKIPSRGKLLSHPVSPSQYSFMHGIGLAGGASYVLLGIGETNSLLCFDFDYFKDGNITVKELKENPGMYREYKIHYLDVASLMDGIYGEVLSWTK